MPEGFGFPGIPIPIPIGGSGNGGPSTRQGLSTFGTLGSRFPGISVPPPTPIMGPPASSTPPYFPTPQTATPPTGGPHTLPSVRTAGPMSILSTINTTLGILGTLQTLRNQGRTAPSPMAGLGIGTALIASSQRAGAIGMPGTGMVGGFGTTVDGQSWEVDPRGKPCGPSGYHLNRSNSPRGPKGSYWVRNRHMNPLNASAARRAIRRIKGARKMLQSIERSLPKRAAPRFAKKR